MKKKSLLFALATLFSLGGMICVVPKASTSSATCVHAEDEYEEEKNAAKEQIHELACLEEYSGDAHTELEAKIKELENQINESNDPHFIDQIVSDFEVYLEWYFYNKYYPSIGYTRNHRKLEVEYFLENFSFEDTEEANNVLNAKVEETLTKLDNAKSREEIESIFQQYCYYIEFNFYRTYRVLSELKEEALEYIDSTLARLEEYSEENQVAITRSATYAKENINKATKNSEVYTQYDKYLEYFENVPTITMENLEKVRADLLHTLRLACDIGERILGNTHDVDVFHVYYDWAYSDIERASSIDEAYEYYNGFIENASTYIPDIVERIEIEKNNRKTISPEEKADDNKKTGLIIACVMEGSLLVLAGASIAIYFLLKKKRKQA